MTEPVARPSVRRTVRTAVALLAGQAALCAVIGWVTFGATHGGEPGAPPTVDPMAGAPLVIPPPTAVPAPRPPVSSSIAPAVRTTRRHAGTWTPATRPPSPSARSSSPAADRPTVLQASSAPAAAPVPPSPSEEPELGVPSSPSAPVQAPVTLHDPCDPVGALGLTADDVPVRCVRGDDGVARWQIN